MEIDIVLTADYLITMNEKEGIIEKGAIGIKGEKIVYVGRNDEFLASNNDYISYNFPHHILMPGLINTHTHLPMTLFRGLADDLSLKEWLEKYIFPAESKFISPETVRYATALAISEMLLSGTTTLADGYFFEDEILAEAKRCGIRGVFAQGIIDCPAPGVPDPKDNLSIAKRFLEKNPPHGKQRGAIFAHSPYTCSKETLIRAKELSREMNALYFIHVAETRWEVEWVKEHFQGLTPVRFLNDLGILDDKTVLVHAIYVDEGEQEIIKETGAGISICTEGEMKLASGIPPLMGYIEKAIPVGLGTDGAASNNDLDMFSEMDVTAKIHKLKANDPSLFKAEDILELATIGGAKALGLEDQIGSIEPGKYADIIAINYRAPHMYPIYNPYSQIVYTGASREVEFVMVSGEVLVEKGKLVKTDLYNLFEELEKITSQIKGLGKNK